MNDPGLDKPISNDAREVENQMGHEKKEEDDEEYAFLEPRWIALRLLFVSKNAEFLKSMVVRKHSISIDCGHTWSHGICL